MPHEAIRPTLEKISEMVGGDPTGSSITSASVPGGTAACRSAAHGHPAKVHVELGRRDLPTTVANLDLLDAQDGFALDYLGNRRGTPEGQPVDAVTDQETGPGFRSGAERLEAGAWRSPTSTHGVGSPRNLLDCAMLLSPRTLLCCSLGMRVGSTCLFSALVRLNGSQVQSSTAARPAVVPAVVSTWPDCMSRPQMGWSACWV